MRSKTPAPNLVCECRGVPALVVAFVAPEDPVRFKFGPVLHRYP